MSNDFPEGGFIPPHKERKKPDCDRKPLIPDPCVLRNPKNQNFFSTDPPCLNDEIEIVCPADIIVTKKHNKVVTETVVPKTPSDPIPDPPSPSPGDSFGNVEIVVACPTNQAEANQYSEYLNQCGIDYPDTDGQFPGIGNSIRVHADTYFAATQVEADNQAKAELNRIVCDSLECLWGNEAAVYICEDYLTEDDKAFLAENNLGLNDLIKGEPIEVPENLFTSSVSLADANAKAFEYAESIIQDLCFYCNIEKHKPCPEQNQPTDGYTVEECSMQNTFELSSLREVDNKAQEFLDSLDCVEIPFFNDDFCDDFNASIKLINPNIENDCGDNDAEYKKGTKSGEIANDSESCGFHAEIELPKIPCPCGYDFEIKLKNPNTEEACGDNDAEYKPGTDSNDILSVPDNDEPCKQVIDLELPKIPCPCGYDFEVKLDNPNTEEACGTGDAEYKPGTDSNDILSTPDPDEPCKQVIDLAMPKIPCPCGYDFEINLENPNIEPACGTGDAEYKPGMPTGKRKSTPDADEPCKQTIDLRMPKIPCPCGYDFEVDLTNPNTAGACGSGDSRYTPGTGSGKIQADSDGDPCVQTLELEMPQIPCACGYKILMFVRSCTENENGSFTFSTVRYGEGTIGDPCTINLGLVTIPCIPFADIDIAAIIADLLDTDICIPVGINLCVVNPNGSGTETGRNFSPGSDVVDPSGNCLDEVQTFDLIGDGASGSVKTHCWGSAQISFGFANSFALPQDVTTITPAPAIAQAHLGSSHSSASSRSSKSSENSSDSSNSSRSSSSSLSSSRSSSSSSKSSSSSNSSSSAGRRTSLCGGNDDDGVLGCDEWETIGDRWTGGGNGKGTLNVPTIKATINYKDNTSSVRNFPVSSAGNFNGVTLDLSDPDNDCAVDSIDFIAENFLAEDDAGASVSLTNGCPPDPDDMCTLDVDIEFPSVCGEIELGTDPKDQVKIKQIDAHSVPEQTLKLTKRQNPNRPAFLDDASVDCMTDGTDPEGGCLFGLSLPDFQLPCIPVPDETEPSAKIRDPRDQNNPIEIKLEKEDCVNGIALFKIPTFDFTLPCVPSAADTAADGADIDDANENNLGTLFLEARADPDNPDCQIFQVAGGPIVLPCIPTFDTTSVVEIRSEESGTLGNISLKEEADTGPGGCPIIGLNPITITIPDFECPFTVTSDTVDISDYDGGSVGSIGLTQASNCGDISITGGSITLPCIPTISVVSSSNFKIEQEDGTTIYDADPITIDQPTDCEIEIGIDADITIPCVTVAHGTDAEVDLEDKDGNNLGTVSVLSQTNSDGCQEIQLGGGPITIDLPDCTTIESGSANQVDFTDSNDVTIGTISLTEQTTNDCTVIGITGGPIKIDGSVTGNDYEPEAGSGNFTVSLDGTEVGSTEVSINASDEIELSSTNVDLDSCAIVEAGLVTSGWFTFSDPDGNTATLGPNFPDGGSGTCTLQFDAQDGHFEVLDGWSPATINVCTSSGNETWTILKKD